MKIFKVDPSDNVAVVTATTGYFNHSSGDSNQNEVRSMIPFGEKVALKRISKGEAVIRYGAEIGRASSTIDEGQHVRGKDIELPKLVNVETLAAEWKPTTRMAGPDTISKESTLTFEGYRNADGTAATRNFLAILPTVECVSGIVKQAVRIISQEMLPQYPNVDGVVYLDHVYGRVAIESTNSEIPIRTIQNLSKNPNFGGQLMMVGLGCEKLRRNMMSLGDHSFINLQDERESGFQNMLTEILAQAQVHLEKLNNRVRETCPVSLLTVGLQCGGSDSLSGLTANPLLGRLTDTLVAHGASVIFSETTEIRDAAGQLFRRIVDPEVAAKLSKELRWYEDYLCQHGVDHSANTTPGNKAGGISNIVEKAMGSVTKSGSSNIVDVLGPGEKLYRPGLNFLSGPASDFVSGTLQFAAGATLHIFTTGRGSPYSIDGFPTVKVSSNTGLYNKWSDLIDFDAGRLISSPATQDECDESFLSLVLDCASGNHTAAEKLGISNSIVLFNPAAIT